MTASPKSYAGVGSRQTPGDVLLLMTRLAYALEVEGWTLRSGGAQGADQAFARGAQRAEIYLPWPSYEDNSRYRDHSFLSGPETWTMDVAAGVHPRWADLSQGAQKLHARNVHQVRGRHADDPHSSFLVCWTPDGAKVGGTATAIKLAELVGCEVRNLAFPNVRAAAQAFADRVLDEQPSAVEGLTEAQYSADLAAMQAADLEVAGR